MSLPATSASAHPRARTSHRLKPKDVVKILCHRKKEDVTQYLVLWRTKAYPLIPPRSVASWHPLDEVSACLHLVQAYVESIPLQSDFVVQRDPSASRQLKRRTPGAASARDAAASAKTSSGLLTPSQLSRTPSASSSASTTTTESNWLIIDVYNAILQRREGWIRTKNPKKSAAAHVNITNASRLPTLEMLEHAALHPIDLETVESAIRYAFMEKLRNVEGVDLENLVDTSTPSLNFDFVHDYVLRNGIERLPPDAYEGCDKPCRPDMGSNCGCEYTAYCGCLEYAAVDEQALEKKSPKLFVQYKAQLKRGGRFDTTGLPKKFPYRKATAGVPSVLQPFYREQKYGRYAIYECNANCNCGEICKSRLVQRGRKVGLTIFKTPDRGWGVKCTERLIAGEFIDIYLGEVITNAETTRREDVSTDDKTSYLYSLDKFVGDENDLTKKTCYVVDGQYMGNATRFINHSCDPNCRQYTVSYNKHDPRIYDLAFFAIEDIRAGTELTFDYLDQDDEPDEDVFRKREEKARDPKNKYKKRCNCGEERCRWFLWE